MSDKLDLVSGLGDDEKIEGLHALDSVSPDAGKYRKDSSKLAGYLSPGAEWMACARVQSALLETRCEFGHANRGNFEELEGAIGKLSALNMSLLEEQVTHHDQLAVLEEIGRHVSAETKALLHPGTTSYDILDTARSVLLRECWAEAFRPKVKSVVEQLCSLGDRGMDILQVGRTHLQDTSPVRLGGVFAGYAARLAGRVEKCDSSFGDLRGKVSGIVGTGASVEMVVGDGCALDFEREVLAKLGLEPDYTATQIVQKERLADVGHAVTTLKLVLGDLANDVRLLYSSAIREVTSRDNAERLGGSSADATKNNPINYENIAGKDMVVVSGMIPLYDMVRSDLQRDLRSSVLARYQPQQMIAETYESFCRACRALAKLSVNEDVVDRNLQAFRDNPSEAFVSILRGERWVHPAYGTGHDFVKALGKRKAATKRSLLDLALEDEHFRDVYEGLTSVKKQILQGRVEHYLGCSEDKARMNIGYAKDVCARPPYSPQ